MPETKEIVLEGWAIELDGKYWGIQYEDGHFTEYGWGPIEKAIIEDPRYVKKTTDVTYKNSPYIHELERGHFVKVKRTTTYEVKEIR